MSCGRVTDPKVAVPWGSELSVMQPVCALYSCFAQSQMDPFDSLMNHRETHLSLLLDYERGQLKVTRSGVTVTWCHMLRNSASMASQMGQSLSWGALQ